MRSITNQKGFLLLDSLFAIVITSVALVALVGMVTMGIQAFTTNREQTRAYQVAASYGDALQSLSVQNWADQVADSSYHPILTSAPDTINDYLTEAKTNLATLPGSPKVVLSGKISSADNAGDRLAQVKIEIIWNNGANRVQLIKYYIRDTSPNTSSNTN